MIAEKDYFNYRYCKYLKVSRVWDPWGTSILRQELNGKFIEEAFLPEEKAILMYSVEEHSETYYDKVFILSEDEALKYFKDESARKLKSSELREDGTTPSVAWVLRTKGKGKYSVIVQSDGKIEEEAKEHVVGMGGGGASCSVDRD